MEIRYLRSTDDRYIMVVTDGENIVGTSSFGRSRLAEIPDYGEIIAIYFLPEYVGKGHGKRLLSAVLNELRTMGFNAVFLWVLEDNRNARRFYEKFGFNQSNRNIEALIGGKCLKEVQYCYKI